MDRPISSSRPDNLYEPVDGTGGDDAGAHGIFGERSRGMLDPSFLSSLPGALGSLGRSVADRGRDVLRHPPRRLTRTAR
jgi:hypothetical protein